MYLRSVLGLLRRSRNSGPSRRSLPLSPALVGLAITASAAFAAPQSEQEEDDFDFARNLYRQADHSTAADLLANFIQNYPNSERLADARLLLARSYRLIRECDLAIPVYERFYTEHRDDLRTPEARLERAGCLEVEGRNLEAAGSFEEVQKRHPARETAARALLQAAGNYTAATRPKQAARVLQRVIEEYPDDDEVHAARYRLATLLFATGNAPRALQLLAEVAAVSDAGKPPPEAASALLLSGSIHLFRGNPEAAGRAFNRLTSQYAKTTQADSARLALASYQAERGRTTKAVEAYASAYRDAATEEAQLDARVGLADALRRAGRVDESLGHYQALVKARDPDHPSYNHIRLGLASSVGRSGDFTGAYNLLTRIIRSAPRSAEAIASYRELGLLYQERRDYNSAITWFDTYLQAAPGGGSDHDQVKLSLARVYDQIGHPDQAIPLLRGLARDSPSVALFAQFELAQILELDQPRQALHEYVRFLERSPGDARAAQARERVEYLSEFRVLDQSRYDRLFQQNRLQELAGTPHQIHFLDLALALYDHHDIAGAVSLLETYVAQYPDSALRPRAQYHLAEGLGKLGRQRQLEGDPVAADSLRRLGLQEHRILAATPAPDEWSQRSELSLIEAEAATGDSTHYRREAGYRAFIESHGDRDQPLAALALLRLAEAQRLQAGSTAPDSLAEAAVAAAMASYRRLLTNHPESPFVPQALHGLGLCHSRQGEHAAAADTLAQVRRRYPRDAQAPDVLLDLGDQLLRDGRPREAVARLQEMLLAYPAYPDKRRALRLLGDAHFAAGDPAAAIGNYEQWIEGAGAVVESIPVRLRLATCYRATEQPEAALGLLTGVIERHPEVVADSVRFARAELFADLDRTEEAIATYEQVGKRATTTALAATAARRAGDLLFDLGRYARAHTTYAPLLATTDLPSVHGRAVLSLFRLERLKEAKRQAKTFAKRFAQETYWQQSFSLEEGRYYQEAGDHERALKIFEKVERTGGDWAAEAGFQAATSLWAINEQDPSEETAAQATAAQEAFVKRYADSPRAVAVHMRMGDHFFKLGRLPEAIVAYKEVLEGDSPVADRRVAIYRVYNSYFKSNLYDDAHRFVWRLLQEYPEHPKRQNAEMDLASILAAKGQFVEAVDRYRAILETASGDLAAEARYLTGEAYQSMGNCPEAIKHYYGVSYYGADAAAQWISTADYKRGQCYEHLGRLESALKAYERIVQREGAGSVFGTTAQERIAALRLRLEGKAVQ